MRLVLALLAAAAVGCAPSVPPQPLQSPARVRVLPASITLPAGGTVQLAAEVDDATGHAVGGAPLAFTSGDERLLRVSALGFASAVGPVGSTVVTVASGALSASAAITVVPAPASQLIKAAGDGQTARVGEALPAQLQVTVKDSSGNHIAGAEVTFSVTGGGACTPAKSRTDDAGRASASWTLGPTPGRQEATAAGAGLSATFGAMALPAPIAPPDPTPDAGPPAPVQRRGRR